MDAFKYLEIFICLFLIVRFNPFIKAELRDFDQYLIFVSGFIILTNIGILEYFMNFLQNGSIPIISSIITKINTGKTPSTMI